MYQNSFTFQYGSIQIDFENGNENISIIFTFQYGSIQIARGYRVIWSKKIYIPIWFYSNRASLIVEGKTK